MSDAWEGDKRRISENDSAAARHRRNWARGLSTAAISVGATVLIDFPGHVLHGKRAHVAAIEPEFNLAPEGAPPWPAMTIFIKALGLLEPIGVGLEHIAGTVEASRRRAADVGEDDASQGSLAL